MYWKSVGLSLLILAGREAAAVHYGAAGFYALVALGIFINLPSRKRPPETERRVS